MSREPAEVELPADDLMVLWEKKTNSRFKLVHPRDVTGACFVLVRETNGTEKTIE